MMISNEGVHAETPVAVSSNDSRKMCTNVGRVQLSIDHPSGKTSLDSAGGSSIGNQMKLAHITNASKDMDYSLKREEIDKDKTDDANTSEVESEAVHVTHSVLKLQESIGKTPEQRTYTKPIPTLVGKPEDNLEDNDDLTLMVSNG